MKAIKELYDKIEEFILAASLAFTVILIFIQIIMRYILNNSLSWSEELARYIFIWQCWMGVSLAYRKDAHIKLDILPEKLKGKLKVYFEIFVLLIVFMFNIMLTKWGIDYVLQIKNANNIGTATGIPLWLVYSCLPCSCIIISVRIISDIIQKMKKK